MKQSEEIIKIAKQEIGTHESDSGDDKYIKDFNQRTGWGLSLSAAWCAMFVTWCKNQLNISKDVIPDFASCDNGMKFFMNRNLFNKAFAYGGSYIPKEGDIVFFSSKHDMSDSTHVGFVLSAKNGKLNTIEGNSSDSVRTRTYTLSSKYILGYATPKYESKSSWKDTMLEYGEQKGWIEVGKHKATEAVDLSTLLAVLKNMNEREGE